MKAQKWIALTAVGLVGASIVIAQPVRSRNAVGYVRRTLDSGKLYLMCVNFNTLEVDNSVTNIWPPQSCGLPVGTKLYFWDQASQQYSSSSETLSGFPPPTHWDPGTNDLLMGQSFWIRIPEADPATNYDVYVMGEVPGQSNEVVSIAEGVNFAAYSFPVITHITNSALSDVLEPGDKVYYYDPDNTPSPWVAESLLGFPPPTHWDPGTHVFQPGEGFLIISGTNVTWTEDKPYTWPE